MAASLYDLGLLAVNGFANEKEAEAANFDRLKWLRSWNFQIQTS